MKFKLYMLTVLSLLALIASGCTAAGTPATTGNLGSIQINVTDAPGADNVTAVLVTISQVSVHRAAALAAATPTSGNTTSDNSTSGNVTSASPPADNTTAANDNGEWVKIRLPAPVTFDLLTIQNGIQQALTSDNIQAGKYTQIRLTIDKVEVGLNGQSPVEAKLPSNELKIVRPFEISPDKTTALLLDFDANKMVTVAGNGKVNVKPTVKLTIQQPKAHEIATVQGTIGAVDTANSNITILPAGNTESVILDITAKTEITVAGKSAAFAELKIGANVTATYYQDTLTAVKITVP